MTEIEDGLDYDEFWSYVECESCGWRGIEGDLSLLDDACPRCGSTEDLIYDDGTPVSRE